MSGEGAKMGPRRVRLADFPTVREAAVLVAASMADGGLVIVPTDTVYGLAARASDQRAVEAIFAAKRRDHDRKLPLLVAEPEDLDLYAALVPAYARDLAARFWPGALTMVVRAAATLEPWLVDGRGTVALRCPGHDLVREVARRVGGPIAATSVNLSGMPEAVAIEDVPDEIAAKVALLVDGGPTPGAVSTVVDCVGTEPRVLRSGAVSVC